MTKPDTNPTAQAGATVTDAMVEAASAAVVAEWKAVCSEADISPGEAARQFVSPGNHRLVQAALEAAFALAAQPAQTEAVGIKPLVELSARCRRLAYPVAPPIFIEIADALDEIVRFTIAPAPPSAGAEAEPVAWRYRWPKPYGSGDWRFSETDPRLEFGGVGNSKIAEAEPLYAAPQEQVSERD